MSTLSCMGALSQGSSDGTLGNAGGVNTKEPYINGGGAPEPWAEARWCVMGGRGWQAERSSCAEPPGGTMAAQHLDFPLLKVGIHFPCAVALCLRWRVGEPGAAPWSLRRMPMETAGPLRMLRGRPWSPGFPERLGPCVSPPSGPVASGG